MANELTSIILSDDFHFAWPWLLAALLLPFLVRWLLPATSAHDELILVVPQATGLELAADSGKRAHTSLSFLFALLIWALLTVAAARPQLLGENVSAPVTGRNLMLAIDLSGSMEVRDFSLGGRPVNRLVATKAVASEFIDRRAGDRLGLILFGERAYLQAPLTFDRTTVKTLLMESALGLAGEKTAIGDAITLAVKRIRDGEDTGGEQVLILLTDGANTAGAVPPLKGAELAAQVGLRIYTIGIGADRMKMPSLTGIPMRQINPSMDLDEDTLTKIAELTGGRYFRARNTGALQQIYSLLDDLEPAADDEKGLRPVIDVFYWPLGAAWVLILIGLVFYALHQWHIRRRVQGSVA